MSPATSRISSLSLFWFCNLGVLGVWLPYFSLYLRENAALPEGQVGLVLAVLPLAALAAFPFWGWFSDRTGWRKGVLALLCAGSGLSFLALGKASGFYGYLLGAAAVAFFYRATTPMLMGASLAVTKDLSRHAFGIARAFGTVGFLVMVVTFPWVLESFGGGSAVEASSTGGSEPGLGVLFPWMAVLSAVSGCAALLIPQTDSLAVRSGPGEFRRLLRHGPLVRLLAYILLANFLVRGPINFLPLLVRERGGDVGAIAGMWLVMLLIEIPLVAVSGAFLSRLGTRRLLTISMLSEGIRWTVSGWSGNLEWLAAAQALHGIGVVGLHVALPLQLDAAVPSGMRSSGQGLAAMAGVGAGAIASNAVIGYVFEISGSATACLAVGLTALCTAALSGLILPRPTPDPRH